MESTKLRKVTNIQQLPHTFDVFLSYSRKDRDFAIKLEKALEDYRFPKSLKSDKRNINVFRDEADIEAAGDYYRAIEQHLKGASKLVVVCSPDARKSKYVEDEIRRFIETHSEKDVIPVLVRGKANNEAEHENEKAFPEALCENRMPLAANFLGYDIRKAKLDKGQFSSSWYSILSAIYEIDRRRLEQIDEKLRARKQLITLGAAAAIILILLVALVFAVFSRWDAEEARNDAERQRDESISNELSLYSTSLLQSDPELSLLLATKAAQTKQTQQSENALRQALVKAPLHVLNATETNNDADNDAEPRIVEATFSPDGKHILAWGANKAMVWDVEGASNVFAIPGNGVAMAASYNYDGKLIVTGSGDTVRTYDSNTGRQIAEWKLKLEDEDKDISVITISPDSKFLLIGTNSSEGVKLFEMGTGRVVDALEGNHPVFSPDGQAMLTKQTMMDEEKLNVFDTQTWNRIAQRDAKIGGFSPDDKYILAVSSSEKWNAALGHDVWTSYLRWYDRKSMRKVHSVPISGGLINAKFSPSGDLVAVTTGKGLYLWDSIEQVNTKLADWSDKEEEKLVIAPISFSPDSRFLLGGFDATLLYDVESEPMRVIAKLDGGRSVLNAAFSPDGKHALTVNKDSTIFVWNLDVWRSQVERRLEQRDFPNNAFNPSGKFIAQEVISQSESGKSLTEVRVWKVENGEVAQTIPQPEAAKGFAFSSDGKVLISYSDATSYIWEPSSGRKLDELKIRDYGKVKDYSLDSNLFVTVSDKTVRVWDANVRQTKSNLPMKNSVGHVVLSPDGKRILIISKVEGEGFIEQLCDLNGECSSITTPKCKNRANVLFSPDGKLVLNVCEDRLQVIDVLTKRMIELFGYTDSISSAAFSPDSKYVMTTSTFDNYEEYQSPSTVDAYNEVRVWDLSNGSLVYEFKGRHNANMLSGTFTASGKSFLVLTADGMLLTYSCEVCVPQDELIKLAMARNFRDLTLDERVRYLHESPRQ